LVLWSPLSLCPIYLLIQISCESSATFVTHTLNYQLVLYELFIFNTYSQEISSAASHLSVSLPSAVFISWSSSCLLIRPSVFISYQPSTPTILSYCFINQHMTSKYIINTVFIYQLW
jgi:hypothetical protein